MSRPGAFTAGLGDHNSGYYQNMDTLSPTFDRITVEPGKCGGKPCIRGMRITVRRVLEILAACPNREEIFREYPFLEEGDLHQSLLYAAASVDSETFDFRASVA